MYFKNKDFHAALRTFFKNLHIPVNYIAEESVRPQDILEKTYKEDHPKELANVEFEASTDKRVCLKDAKYVADTLLKVITSTIAKEKSYEK